jgi:Leucine-rich repeat (LRR) protein
VFSKAAVIGLTPTKEELAKIPLIDSLNIENTSINTLEPIIKLQKLKVVIMNHSRITDLLPLKGNKEIRHLEISDTEIKDISTIVHFPNLKILYADNSKIENIELLIVPGLERLYADHTPVHDIIVKEFLDKNPACLVVYKTDPLNRWWNNLSPNWQEVFKIQIKTSVTPTREQLHQLTEQESLEFKDIPITDLSGLSEFIRLKELHFSGTAMINIAPLDNIKSLTSLHATHSPIQSIESLNSLSELEDLDISNTPIEDVYELWRLKKLKKLNCAGTQIKRLDALEKMENLEYLDCSNTNVSKLSPLDYLPLATLKCYNTKVSTRSIENFKASHTNCQVMYYR